MRTLAAMTDSVFQQLEGGWMSDDTRLSYDLVRDKILRVRAELIGKVFASRIGILPDSLYQRCCIELTCIEQCSSGLYRLSGKVPGLLGLIGDRSIRFVGTVEGKSFERRRTSGKRYELYQPLATINTSYRITGDDIELYDAPLGLGIAVVEAILADPSTCPPCVDDDQLIVPLPADMLDAVEVQSLKELEQLWLMPRDKRNDSSPSK